jgi:ABC-type dipeptide/oligopeptide/nickel transport system permease subunit/outer membrane protein assembly factor BamB
MLEVNRPALPRSTTESEPVAQPRRFIAINWPLLVGGFLILLVLAVALVGPRLAPRDPMVASGTLRVGQQWLSPPYPPLTVPSFPLGTDPQGRDLLSRLLWAVRPTLLVVIVAALLRLGLGTLVGAVSGWSESRLGQTLDFLITGALALPILIVSLVVLAAISASQGTLAFVVGLSFTGWAETARIVREQTRVIKQQTYVEAARALGGSGAHMLSQHVLRQLLPLLVVLLPLEIGSTLLLTAALGFLGYYIGGESWLAISDTSAQRMAGAPELGQMLSGSIGTVYEGPWQAFAAGLMIVVIILGFNLFGEGLRLQLEVERGRRTRVGAFFGRLNEAVNARVMEPMEERYGLTRARTATAVLVVLLLASGFSWWRAQAAASAVEGLPVPGGHWWASERRDPYGTLWTPALGPRAPTIRWQFQDDSGFVGGPAVAADGTLYIASRDGTLYALNAEGVIRFELPLPASPVGVPALDAEGRIYVTDQQGALSAFSPEGEALWRFQPESDSPATSGPIVGPEGNIFYTVNSQVQAVTAVGEPLWREVLLRGPVARAPHLDPTGTWLFLDNHAVHAETGAPADAIAQGVDQYAMGADGVLYTRVNYFGSHLLSRWQITEAGTSLLQEIQWADRGDFISPARDIGATPQGLIWMAFYFDRHEDAKFAWTNPGGASLGRINLPHRPTYPIAVDGENVLYTCGVNPGSGPECLALRPGNDQQLWQLPLPEGSMVNGGAVTPGWLYVTTSEGVLYAIGDEER